ncbi:DUF3304 domain-containing protein [Massilia sp. LjRoot122]|uniref:DUF3304 domain-containing protein n=1 Tax=Massilia sp. LjRoot122 TaxID=3342257 RepID=UPI003ECDA48D
MVIRVFLMVIFLLPASAMWAFEHKTAEVNLHGVNYSEYTFRFYVVDPADPNAGGWGDLVGPFSAGGITCCATLPKSWRPGMKLEVKTIHWLNKLPDGARQEIHEIHQVEIPRYAIGKPGELWILRESSGKISAVSSDLQPNHPNWPGRIKGWPVPSLEYRREKWAISKKHEEDGVAAAVELLDELERSPAQAAQKIWETEKKYDPKSVEGFAGPHDPRYWSAVKQRIRQGLAQTKQRLQVIVEARP